MFHKKQYIAIAGAIRQARQANKADPIESLVARLLPIFAADNPLFDAGKFTEACKPAKLEGIEKVLGISVDKLTKEG